ncbi:MAG TPA: YceI family protein [Nocardioidaceae bacterium]|nr:YceI family protein [Nocardioidaceae bacterium]
MSTTVATQLPTGTYTIDTAHSTVGFVARHAMVTKVRGSFTEFEGNAVVAEDLAQSSASITIKVDSINTRNEQRDGHLRSNDFFDIENHPEISFVSTSVAPLDNGLSVTGDLTIKGTTKPVTIDFEFTGSATDPFGNQRVGFEGSVVVNRKDWGVNWNAALEAGGVLVSEKVTLEFDISAIKAA